MSSIYRKGRDGYFYYQKYIYNPISKKKDKKIFHSLGTKNRAEALEFKDKLDKKYDREKKTLIRKNYLYKYLLRSTLILFSLVFIIIGFSNIIIEDKDKIVKKKNKYKPEAQLSISDNQEKELLDVVENNLVIMDNIEDTLKTGDPLLGKKDSKSESFFDYEIARSEVLSHSFRQIKFYINIDPNLSDDSILKLCEKLVKDNSEFINFIICFYTNDNIGKALARGNIKDMNKKEISESWLVMYTYNEVEGAYYDNNPGSYMRNDL